MCQNIIGENTEDTTTTIADKIHDQAIGILEQYTKSQYPDQLIRYVCLFLSGSKLKICNMQVRQITVAAAKTTNY